MVHIDPFFVQIRSQNSNLEVLPIFLRTIATQFINTNLIP